MDSTHVHHHDETSAGLGWVVGLMLLIALAFLLFYYGLPAFRGAATTPQINVPGQIDVNMNQPQAPQPQQ
jgi:hypothetical protein